MEKKVKQIAVQIFKSRQEAERAAVEMVRAQGFSSAEYYSCANNLVVTDCRQPSPKPAYYEEQSKAVWVTVGLR